MTRSDCRTQRRSEKVVYNNNKMFPVIVAVCMFLDSMENRFATA